MDDKQIDKSEIEKIFGSPRRINLFDENEDYYNVIRPNILMQPAERFKKRELPFSGIRLIPYTDYCKQKAIEDAKSHKQHVFYIRKSTKGSCDYCDAAGYYDNKKREFIILKYSYIVSTNHYSFEDLAHQIEQNNALITKGKAEDNNMYLTEDIICVNPVYSASYVLGKKASIIEWVDEKGKSILSYYPDLAQLQEITRRAEIVEDNKQETVSYQKKSLIDAIVTGLLQYKIEKESEISSKNHVFYIKEKGVCYAFGYFEPETNYFYILKDSLVSLFVDKEYSYTNSGNARVRFIDKACAREKYCFRVIKDAKCRSASAAASYALGRSATYVEWIDKEGKGLKDFYPLRFFQTKEQVAGTTKTVVTDPKQHIFYIKKNLGLLSNCDAKGYYDPVTKNFIILAGSTLAYEVVGSYRYTTADISRRLFINSYCEKLKTCYRVKKDTLVDSPKIASYYVTGRNTNGWTEWIDNNGKTLNEIYGYQ